MDTAEAKLISRIKRTESVESFRFFPEKRINFLAGQFLQIIFNANDPADKELNKYLSFSSSPAKDYIEVTKRLSESKFSNTLKALKVNDRILLKGPFGNCVFKKEYKKISFLIGGIGITPVISILEYISETKLTNEVLVLYSNKTELDIAFKKELDEWANISKNIKVIYCVTEVKPCDNLCIFGRIDKNLILDQIPGLKNSIIFIFGPPKMVEATRAITLDCGVNPQNIKTESFIGY
jgi:glycine betaine catabolism B